MARSDRLPLAQTFDLMLEFGRALSLEAVYAVVLRHGAPFGVQSVLAGIIPDRIIHPSEQPAYVILGSWPTEWAQRYFSQQYVRYDPTILHCAVDQAPLSWSNLQSAGQANAMALQIMNEAREFGLSDGLTVPQLSVAGSRIGVSFSGDRIDQSLGAVAELSVIASYAVARSLELAASTSAAPTRLSLRERECLLWAAEGKTMADIGAILSVSDSAVEKYLASARQKLASLTTTQAVVQALRLGLI